MTSIRAVKGTHDILPDQMPAWHRVEAAARELFARYGYREMRTPIFEPTELFARGIGDETDIVSKEMYTFTDPGGESLTLRPEATAGIIRAVIEHNLVNEDPALRVYALGPMFRRERPQKGRYRQFHQLDVEAIGETGPSVDTEMIEMAVSFLEACGLEGHEVVLNSVGDAHCRPAYVDELRHALRAGSGRLGPDSQRRTETNPLRVLDSKAPDEQTFIESLPRIADFLCPECQDHFSEVKRGLDLLGIRYRESHRLVRGLDYYVRTTFEITSPALGAQSAILGGGRYDGLIKTLGGPDVGGIGFGLGLERLVMLVPPQTPAGRCDVYLAPLVNSAVLPALLLQRSLRAAQLKVLMGNAARSFKARMKQADKLGVRFTLILGDSELAQGVWAVRDMASSSQEEVPETRLLDYLKEKLNG